MTYEFPEFRQSSDANLNLTVATMTTLIGMPNAPERYMDLWQAARSAALRELAYRAAAADRVRAAIEAARANAAAAYPCNCPACRAARES